MASLYWRLCLSTLLIVGFVVPAYATTDGSTFSTTVDEFRRLSPADQRALIVAAFEYRLDHARNVHYESETRVGNYEYTAGVVGKRVNAASGASYRHWRLSNSYRMDIDKHRVDDPEASRFSVCGFDAQAGISRSTVRHKGNDRLFGRIDSTPQLITLENRYNYWLDGKATGMGDYLFRFLVANKDSYVLEVSANEGTVHLTLPWRPPLTSGGTGTRQFVLLPQKGFLPVRGKARWEKQKSGGDRSWRTEEFAVEKSELAKDVWMPTKLTERVGGSSLGPNTITIWETTARSIEFGTVTERDLEVAFPEGTEVTDVIKKVAYVVGPNGEELRPQRLIGALPSLPPVVATDQRVTQPATQPEPVRSRGVTRYASLIGVILGVAGLLLALRFHRRRRSESAA